jgi:hypothetical protein
MSRVKASYHPFTGLFGRAVVRGASGKYYRTTYGFEKFNLVTPTFEVTYMPITGGGNVTDLMRAAAADDPTAVARCIEAGAAVDALDMDGRSVTSYAGPSTRRPVKIALTVYRLAQRSTVEVYRRQAKSHHVQWLQGMKTSDRRLCIAWAKEAGETTIMEQCMLLCVLRERGHAKHTRDAKLMLAYLALAPRAAQTLAALKHL